MNRDEAMRAWLATRPESVRRLAAEFPLGSSFAVDGERLYLLGYTEEDMLIVSPVDPAVDYDGANASKKYLCASHCRCGR